MGNQTRLDWWKAAQGFFFLDRTTSFISDFCCFLSCPPGDILTSLFLVNQLRQGKEGWSRKVFEEGLYYLIWKGCSGPSSQLVFSLKPSRHGKASWRLVGLQALVFPTEDVASVSTDCRLTRWPHFLLYSVCSSLTNFSAHTEPQGSSSEKLRLHVSAEKLTDV